MKRQSILTMALVIAISIAGLPAQANETPHIQRNGAASQLIVDGAPYLALAGELHNSSASSPNYMRPIWDRLAQNGMNTVIGSASWELVEPVEGQFNFDAVDDQIRQARNHHLRLVLIWFGAYKNAESSYAPNWVRRDQARFPRGIRDTSLHQTGIAAFLNGPHLTVFSEALVTADARAFTRLMQHIREIDRDHTVIMIQVENETGMIGTPRDHSALAEAAWESRVPAELISYLRDHRATLRPELLELWRRQGFKEEGTWTTVFGSDASAQEVFMAWAFGRYVERVARAGSAAYPLPMYTNGWLGPQPGATTPGDYPSGGPVARMMDIWKAAAPSLALLAPDIYVDDFAGTLREYHRVDNPIFIPEARFDAGNLFVAVGAHQAMGFSPFGIEDRSANDEVNQAYRVLSGMTSRITQAQAEERIRGFALSDGTPQTVHLGGYRITVSRAQSAADVFGPGTSTAATGSMGGYGLIISTAPDQFVVVGRGISLRFSTENSGETVEVDSAQEGSFDAGTWVPGRTLNGDERFSLFPAESLTAVSVRLLRRH